MKKLSGVIIALGFAVACNAYSNSLGDKIASKLELTPEQTVHFQQVQAKRKAHLQEAVKVRKQIKALMEVGDVDGAAILASQQAEQKVRSMSALKTELATFLSEEQMASLAEIRESAKYKKQRMVQLFRN